MQFSRYVFGFISQMRTNTLFYPQLSGKTLMSFLFYIWTVSGLFLYVKWEESPWPSSTLIYFLAVACKRKLRRRFLLLLIWRPPAFPHRLQCSILGRPGLNHRVRDGNGCVPRAHRHQKSWVLWELSSKTQFIPYFFRFSWIDSATFKHARYRLLISNSLERRWSSRTFRYGYLVTTSPQLSVPP